MNDKQLKELVNTFFEYTKTISICDFELYDIYYDKIKENYINNFDIEKAVKSDILYDFIFNINNIKSQLENDFCSYSKDSNEQKAILLMYKKIKKVFKNFYIKELEV